jgi:hypothetical protein
LEEFEQKSISLQGSIQLEEKYIEAYCPQIEKKEKKKEKKKQKEQVSANLKAEFERRGVPKDMLEWFFAPKDGLKNKKIVEIIMSQGEELKFQVGDAVKNLQVFKVTQGMRGLYDLEQGMLKNIFRMANNLWNGVSEPDLYLGLAQRKEERKDESDNKLWDKIAEWIRSTEQIGMRLANGLFNLALRAAIVAVKTAVRVGTFSIRWIANHPTALGTVVFFGTIGFYMAPPVIQQGITWIINGAGRLIWNTGLIVMSQLLFLLKSGYVRKYAVDKLVDRFFPSKKFGSILPKYIKKYLMPLSKQAVELVPEPMMSVPENRHGYLDTDPGPESAVVVVRDSFGIPYAVPRQALRSDALVDPNNPPEFMKNEVFDEEHPLLLAAEELRPIRIPRDAVPLTPQQADRVSIPGIKPYQAALPAPERIQLIAPPPLPGRREILEKPEKIPAPSGTRKNKFHGGEFILGGEEPDLMDLSESKRNAGDDYPDRELVSNPEAYIRKFGDPIAHGDRWDVKRKFARHAGFGAFMAGFGLYASSV